MRKNYLTWVKNGNPDLVCHKRMISFKVWARINPKTTTYLYLMQSIIFGLKYFQMARWKTKASLFVIRNLCPLLNDRVALSHRHANSNCLYEINNNRTGSIKTKTVTFKDSSAETLVDEEELQFENVINQMEDANREQRVENISDDENANNLTAEPRQKPRIQMKYQTSDGDHDCPMIAQDTPWGSDGQLEYDTRKSIIIESPCDWNYHLKVFYRKHPPPKKKHLKILTKFAPMDNHPKLRRDASVLAERYNASIFVTFKCVQLHTCTMHQM